MILVTAGAGYIGSHVCVSSFATPCKNWRSSTTSCNSHPEALARVQKITGRRLNVVKGDIRDQGALEEAILRYNCTAVIHFAVLKAVGESVENRLEY